MASNQIFEFEKVSRREFNLPFLAFSLRPEWGSTEPQHRSLIREALAFEIQTKMPSTDEAALGTLSVLNEIPNIQKTAISVAHCPSGGGFVWAPTHGRLGLDIEEASRISPDITRRVSSAAEFENAPHHELLWPAKEAAFKALAKPTGIKVISEIHIDQWTMLSTPDTNLNNLLRFRARANSVEAIGIGLLIPHSWVIAAVYLHQEHSPEINQQLSPLFKSIQI